MNEWIVFFFPCFNFFSVTMIYSSVRLGCFSSEPNLRERTFNSYFNMRKMTISIAHHNVITLMVYILFFRWWWKTVIIQQCPISDSTYLSIRIVHWSIDNESWSWIKLSGIFSESIFKNDTLSLDINEWCDFTHWSYHEDRKERKSE